MAWIRRGASPALGVPRELEVIAPRGTNLKIVLNININIIQLNA